MSIAEIKLAALDIGNLIWSAHKSAGNAAVSGGKWVGGALQGEFNTKATVGQIIVDAVISMFPVAGEVTAARDATAIIIRMNESEEAANSTWQWVSLVLCLLAVIPVLGGVLKGVGRLVIRAVSKAEDLAKLGNDVLNFLRKMGYGDAHKWLKELDFAKYQGQVTAALNKAIGYISGACTFIVKNMSSVLPSSVLTSLQTMPAKLAKVQALGSKMIPQAIKELNANLDKVRKALVDGSYIAPITVAGKQSKVAVAEARLAEFASSSANSAGHLPVRGHADVREWPSLKAFYDTFSIKGPPRAITHAPGETTYRVVQTDRLSKPYEIPGRFWTNKLPANGTVWRDKCAIQHQWNTNGHYVKMTIPSADEMRRAGINVPHGWQGMRLWEGKIAQQLDNEGVKATGRLFQGGDTQFFVDFTHEHNKPIAEWIKRNVQPKPTGWRDTQLPSQKQAGVLLLEQSERSAKISQEGYVLRGAATAGKQSNNDKQ